jgi:hypothetical protein
VAFAMRDEWEEEPVSTTGAEYVEPSATELIKPCQRVSHLFPRAVMEEFVLQRVTGTWGRWFSASVTTPASTPGKADIAGSRLAGRSYSRGMTA